MSQKSVEILEKQKLPSGLYLAANGLGLLEDIPSRSIELLRSADLLVFEEDRPARKSLKAAGIHREYIKLTEHQEVDTIESVREALIQGKSVCYMSDQGMPNVADPGHVLLKDAYALGMRVKIIPGPSSISVALAACPFKIEEYRYLGFLPRDSGKRLKAIKSFANHREETLVLLDTPYRRKALIADLCKGLSGSRCALLALDISGPHEEYVFDSLDNLSKLDYGKLNFVLVITPASFQLENYDFSPR